MDGVNSNSDTTNLGNNASKVSNIKSTDTSFMGGNGTENLGIAVFKGDKLVGELSALDTLCLSILQKEVNSFLIQVPDIGNENETIDIMLYPVKKDYVNVKIINGNPYIDINIKLIGRIYSMKGNSKYLDNDVLKNISEKTNKYLQKVFTEYLYKTSLIFKSDINGFGRYVTKNFLTINEFKDFNWQNSYPNSVFNVTINANVESGFLLAET